MGNRTKKVAFIPLRGGSKGIPQKNIKKIAGKPLVYWVLEAALQSGVFEEIYVSTNDPNIQRVVHQHPSAEKFIVISRSSETATDIASTESAMIEFAQNYEFDEIILIQATSPLLNGKHLKEACEAFSKSKDANSLLSVCRQERFIWQEDSTGFVKPYNYNPVNRPRRQDFEGFLVENGAFYITKREALLSTGSRISGNIICYEMPSETYFELDDPTDWIILESYLNKKKNSSLNNISNIKLLLTDVDGVLTDAGMYYSEQGDELKKFNTKDGKGIELLKKSGIKVGIITSEDTQIVANRAKKLNVNFLYQGKKDEGKLYAASMICNELKIDLSEVAYIGDDVNDLAVLGAVGFSACPADAIHHVRQKVDYVCERNGGSGCVREVAELILINGLS